MECTVIQVLADLGKFIQKETRETYVSLENCIQLTLEQHGSTYMQNFPINTVNIFSLPYNSHNNIFFFLAFLIVRIL